MKIRKTGLYLLLIIFIAASVRILYSFYIPNPVVMEDTYSYYSAGQRMIKSMVFVDDSRPPLYSLILNLPLLIMGKFQAPNFSPEFFRMANIITFMQMFFGISGLIILYCLLLSFKVKPRLSLLLLLFLGLDIHYFAAERILLTESLSAFLIILTLWLIVRILQSPRLYLFAPLTLFFILLLLLKPGFLIFPLIAFLIAFYHRRKIRFVLASFFVIAFSFAFVFFYSRENCRYYGYCGFSRISEINLIGQILYFNLPVDGGREIKFFYDCVSNYRKTQKDTIPYRFLVFCDSRIWESNSRFRELGQFNKKVISANLPSFIISSLGNIPNTILEKNEVFAASPKINNFFLDNLFRILFRIYLWTKYLNLIALPVFPLILFLFFKKGTIFLAFLSLLGSIAISQIVTSAFFQYGSFGRLISPIEPELYLFSFLSLGLLFRKMKDLRLRVTRARDSHVEFHLAND